MVVLVVVLAVVVLVVVVLEVVVVPDVVKQAMVEKLYPPTSISIEAYPQFRETRIARELEANVPGFVAPSGPVLAAAALLGSSAPAVKTLADLRAYLSENHDAMWMSERA